MMIESLVPGKEPVLSLRGVERQYKSGDRMLHVLRGVDLDLYPGEMVGMIGPSGSGKSTLLHVAGLLEKPDAGLVMFAGKDALKMSDDARTYARRLQLGFVYQFHHLLPEFSALENVAMPLLIRGLPRAEAAREAGNLLARVGLAGRLSHRPSQLSGGERQRAAVARALITRPRIVLADEPTGNLDGGHARQVLELMMELNRELGTSLVIVTHDHALAARMDRVLMLEDGILLERSA